MSTVNKEKLKESSEEFKEASILHNLLKTTIEQQEEDWGTGPNSYNRTKKDNKFSETFIIKFEDEDDFIDTEDCLEKATSLLKIVNECLTKIGVWFMGPFSFSHNSKAAKCKFTFVLADKETRDLIKKNRKITDYSG